MYLKPCLVLGSGFHRHVFGDSEAHALRPLYDWHQMVGQVAARMQLAIPDRVMSPVQRWETLLLRVAQEGFRNHVGDWCHPLSHQAYLIEREARRCVAAELDVAADNYPRSLRAQIPQRDCWGAIISLNFDSAWLPKNPRQPERSAPHGLPTNKIGRREQRRLTSNLLISGVDGGAHRRVWFPNGTCAAPETIRMGLNDYGATANAIQVAFAHLKRWERENGVSGKSPDGQLSVCTIALWHPSEGVNGLTETMGAPSLPLTWVAGFLYRPLVFAGVGLSDHESGLWWLLAQRGRNLARTDAPSKAFILVDANDRTAFWKLNLLVLNLSFARTGMRVGSVWC